MCPKESSNFSTEDIGEYIGGLQKKRIICMLCCLMDIFSYQQNHLMLSTIVTNENQILSLLWSEQIGRDASQCARTPIILMVWIAGPLLGTLKTSLFLLAMLPWMDRVIWTFVSDYWCFLSCIWFLFKNDILFCCLAKMAILQIVSCIIHNNIPVAFLYMLNWGWTSYGCSNVIRWITNSLRQHGQKLWMVIGFFTSKL